MIVIYLIYLICPTRAVINVDCIAACPVLYCPDNYSLL